jgi:hypothetical protein
MYYNIYSVFSWIICISQHPKRANLAEASIIREVVKMN